MSLAVSRRFHLTLTCSAAALLGFLVHGPAGAVNLGGKDVPKERIVVYLFIGHSNLLSGKAAATSPYAWNYVIPGSLNRPEGWTPAKNPLHQWSIDTKLGTRIGPGMPFLLKMIEKFPGYHIGMLQNPESQAAVTYIRPNPWKVDPVRNRYLKGGGLYNEIMSRAKKLKANVTLGGIVAMLGYMEGESSTHASRFADDVAQMVAAMRADLGLPKLPFLIGQGEWEGSGRTANWRTVRDQIRAIPGKVPFSAVIDAAITSGDYADSHHYNDSGHRKWAARAAEIIQAKGWFPPAAGNTLPAANKPPTVSLRSPAGGATFVSGSSITIAASASDADGSVVRVEFWQDGTKRSADTSAPYEFVWANVPAGSYKLAAKAVDDDGGEAWTGVVTVTVNSAPAVNKPPTVSLQSPAGGTTFVSGSSVTIAASASDADGSIVRVEFWRDGTKLGEDTSAPYEFVWANVPAGSYALAARAVDNDGGEASSSVMTVTVADPADVGAPIHLRINCGDNSVAGWEPQDAYVLDGADYTFPTPMVVAGVANPAPAAVYQTCRRGEPSFSFPSLADGAYILRLHFADSFAPQRRSMDVLAEGRLVVDDLDVAAEAGQSRALVKQVYVQVSDGNGLQIDIWNDGGSDSFVNGIEILSDGGGFSEPSITILSPAGGETWPSGSTQKIAWSTENLDNITIHYSLDGGASWQTLAIVVGSESPDWGAYPWVIPETQTSQARIRIEGYFGEAPMQSDRFEITSGGPDTTPPAIACTTLGLRGTVNDPTVSIVTVGGNEYPVSDGTLNADAASPGGSGTVTIVASDASGNLGSRTLAIAETSGLRR